MRLFTRFRKCCLAGAAGLALAALAVVTVSSETTSAKPPQYPFPQTAKSYLQGFVDWCKQTPPGYAPNTVGFVLVSNRPNANQDATYAEGSLSLTGSSKLQTTIVNGKMSDTRYFNNKRWNYPPGPNDSLYDSNIYPFDPKKADHPTLTLDAATGKATLTMGTKVTFDLQYANGVLYGQLVNGEMFIITLKKIKGVAIPK